jgi:hypoxanthine phosphoribosyltransferase
MNHLYVTWDEYHRLIETLAFKVHREGYAFDSLLCLARGGLRVGDIISRIYDKPLAILAASSYRFDAGRMQGDLDIAQCITTTGGELCGKLLLVDDLVDSGVTLETVVASLKQRFPKVAEVRTAVLWHKASSTFKPDFCVAYLADSPWIHQPFELYDSMGAERLATRLEGSPKS